MKRGVFLTVLLFSAVGVGAGVGANSALPSISEKSSAQEASDGDFRAVEPDEFNLASDGAVQEGSFETPPLELPEVANDVETLPPEAIAAPRKIDAETVVDEAEIERMKNDPLFREFSAAFDEAAPLPALPSPAIPGFETPLEGDASGASEVGDAAPGDGAGSDVAASSAVASALDEMLTIADVDWNGLNVSPENRATLERLDAEIARLSPLWIDAELNKNVVGRRERVWRRDAPERFETNEPEPVAADSDWALAPDAPFYFQVVDAASGDVFYTKAGDFEPVDGAPTLVRDAGTFVLSVEPGPGVPSGRAERTRVLIDGKIQGVDASGTRVVDANLGKIGLYLFDNPARLESSDGAFFAPTVASGEPRLAKLPPNSPVGVRAGKLVLSNGRPEEIFARIVVLCKSKKRLVEILTQPRLETN